jgi:hypothetical protein
VGFDDMGTVKFFAGTYNVLEWVGSIVRANNLAPILDKAMGNSTIYDDI